MPLKGFICPVERAKVPFDHFESCTARNHGRPAFPPWLARFIAERALSDVRHSGLDLTVTRCMSCPRSVLIGATQDYWIDPNRRARTDRGSALHKVAAESMDGEVWYTEHNDPIRLAVYGTLYPSLVEKLGVDDKYVTKEGVVISGQIDAVRRDMTEIVDWKFPIDWNVRWRDKAGKAKEGWSMQLNMLRLLLGQQRWAVDEGLDPDEVLLTTWDHGIGNTEGPAPLRADHMTEEEMLLVRPGTTPKMEAQYTMEEIICLHVEMQREFDKVSGDPQKVEELCASIPCPGETQFNGKACSGYCDVTDVSAALMRKYGRPEK